MATITPKGLFLTHTQGVALSCFRPPRHKSRFVKECGGIRNVDAEFTAHNVLGFALPETYSGCQPSFNMYRGKQTIQKREAYPSFPVVNVAREVGIRNLKL
jgi:hypothetical protein